LAKKLQAEEDQRAKKIASAQKPTNIEADFLLAMKLQEEENRQSGRHCTSLPSVFIG
jgi:cytochrome c-type biogenesis protein CcmH/NrfG